MTKVEDVQGSHVFKVSIRLRLVGVDDDRVKGSG